MKIIDSVGVIFINSSYYLSNIGTIGISMAREAAVLIPTLCGGYLVVECGLYIQEVSST